MTKNTENLICFDLDGVLISSMVVANQLFYRIIEEELGLPLYDYPQQKKYMALSAEDRIESLWEKDIEERGITKEQLEETLRTYRKAKLNAGIPALPNAVESVKMVADNFEFVACVSANPEYLIRDTLRELGILDKFAKITGIDLVQFSKPHPEVYEMTVNYFGLDPSMAMTIEDSTHGIASAKGAGMKAVGVATGLESVEELQRTDADLILPDLTGFTLETIHSIL